MIRCQRRCSRTPPWLFLQSHYRPPSWEKNSFLSAVTFQVSFSIHLFSIPAAVCPKSGIFPAEEGENGQFGCPCPAEPALSTKVNTNNNSSLQSDTLAAAVQLPSLSPRPSVHAASLTFAGFCVPDWGLKAQVITYRGLIAAR